MISEVPADSVYPGALRESASARKAAALLGLVDRTADGRDQQAERSDDDENEDEEERL